jgi:2-dehydro-3-deoxy-D-arabinonate dehydratase
VGAKIALVDEVPDPYDLGISMTIHRSGSEIFAGSTSTANFHRTFDDLMGWLWRENRFDQGVILLTGTGVVPPDELALAPGDKVCIAIDGIGELVNPVE